VVDGEEARLRAVPGATLRKARDWALRVFAAVALFVAAAPARAADDPFAASPVAMTGMGFIGIEGRDLTHLVVDLEYRFLPRRHGLRPVVGVLWTAVDAVHVRAGFGRDFPLAERWNVHGSLSAGYYEQGGGKYLGSTFEFRSAVDLTYLVHDVRVGLSFSHLSNGGIAFPNPGTEALTVVFAWKVGR
jgi:hypothetical protein